ncbi:MAG: GNAT family N-acetyltransferase [Rhizobiales bacterium]|nr:GNAT family N-acetyltransferase [Hyphomicrobiales bacterium]
MNANTRFKLRPSDHADYDAIAEIWHGSASLPGVGPREMPSLAWLRERLDREFAAGWAVTVAVEGSAVLGFVAIKPKESVLDQIFVRPGWLGRGIGQALLAHAKAAMPEGFTLYTRHTNQGARLFYEKAGLHHFRDGVHSTSGDPIAYYSWSGD